jgi:hypothetical protein
MKNYLKIFIKLCIVLLGVENSLSLSCQTILPPIVISDVTFNNQDKTFKYAQPIISPDHLLEPTKITGNSHISFITGEEISLYPGFHTYNLDGSGYFDAKIDSSFQVRLISPDQTNYNSVIVSKFEKLELGIKLPNFINQMINNFIFDPDNYSYINPYDSAHIDVYAIFNSPSGEQIRWNGFYYRKYQTENDEYIEIPLKYNWRIRFAPFETGLWTCEIFVESSYFKTLHTSDIKISCINSNNYGYIEVLGDNKHFGFSEDHNKYFIPIGMNTSWPTPVFSPVDNNKIHDIINDLASKNANTFTILMTGNHIWGDENPKNYVWGYGIEWEKLGVYDYCGSDDCVCDFYNGNPKSWNRQINAWEIDRIIELAENNNMYLKLQLMIHDEFFFDNNIVKQWDRNPYHMYIDGVNDPIDFFQNDIAKDFFKKRLRYIIARWGYSTNIAWFEYLNEIDNALGQADDYLNFIAQWYDEMTNYIRGYLEDKHLVSGGYAGEINNQNTIFYLDNVDFAQSHRYHPIKLSNWERWDVITEQMIQYQKPALFGEMGAGSTTGECRADLELCTDNIFHNALWATSFMSSIGPGLHWWWDELYGKDHANNFIALKSFFDIINFDFENTNYISCATINNSDAVECTTENYHMLSTDLEFGFGWFHNATHYWDNFDIECLDHEGNVMHDPEPDSYIEVINPNPNYIMFLYLIPHGIYEFHFYFPGNIGSSWDLIYHSVQSFRTDNNGNLSLNIHNLFNEAPDFAYTYEFVGYDLTFNYGLEESEHTDTIFRFNIDNFYIDTLLFKKNKYLNNGLCKSAFPITYQLFGYNKSKRDNIIDSIFKLYSNQNPELRMFLDDKENIINYKFDYSFNSDDIKIYPNPTNGLLIISGNRIKDNYYIEIFDIFGNLIFNKHIEYQYLNKLNISNFNAGIYILKLKISDRIIFKKIIKK